MRRACTILLAVTMFLVTVPVSTSQTASEATGIDPVLNGGFEHPPEIATGPLEGTPLDTCIGVGHQAQFGEDTVQGDLAGGVYDDPDPTQSDPEHAVERIQEDPEGEAMFLAGLGHCVWGEDTGYDLAWVTPVERMDQPLHWSKDANDPSVEFTYDHGDPSDRAAKFLPDPNAANQNLWQASNSPFQAFTANFDAFELDLLDGEAPANANVRLSLTPTPLGSQSVAYYNDCVLTFQGDLINQAAGQDGHVSIDPTDARFTSANDDVCAQMEADWDDADTEEDKREILAQNRITQISFWNWNQGDQAVVIDNVALPGASTAAEEAPGTNIDPRLP